MTASQWPMAKGLKILFGKQFLTIKTNQNKWHKKRNILLTILSDISGDSFHFWSIYKGLPLMKIIICFLKSFIVKRAKFLKQLFRGISTWGIIKKVEDRIEQNEKLILLPLMDIRSSKVIEILIQSESLFH
jgi:hypothetical protein